MSQFFWPVRVYYEDTDAGGVMYHANYLNFFERARTEWLRALGFHQRDLQRDFGIVFAVRHLEIDYIAAARFDDALTIESTVEPAGRVAFAFHQRMLDESARLLSEARVKVVCVGTEKFRPVAIPAAIREKFDAQR